MFGTRTLFSTYSFNHNSYLVIAYCYRVEFDNGEPLELKSLRRSHFRSDHGTICFAFLFLFFSRRIVSLFQTISKIIMDLEHCGCAIILCCSCCEMCLRCVEDNENAIHHVQVTSASSFRPPIDTQPVASNSGRSRKPDLNNKDSKSSK